MIPPPVGDCVAIEWRGTKTEQTAEFQSFRMCTLKLCHSSVCSVFLEFLPLIPIAAQLL